MKKSNKFHLSILLDYFRGTREGKNGESSFTVISPLKNVKIIRRKISIITIFSLDFTLLLILISLYKLKAILLCEKSLAFITWNITSSMMIFWWLGLICLKTILWIDKTVTFWSKIVLLWPIICSICKAHCFRIVTFWMNLKFFKPSIINPKLPNENSLLKYLTNSLRYFFTLINKAMLFFNLERKWWFIYRKRNYFYL